MVECDAYGPTTPPRMRCPEAEAAAQTTFHAGTTGDDLFVNVWDGVAFSGPKKFHIDIA
jgi:hypothetical protein